MTTNTEPFVAHAQEDEFYVSIYSQRHGDVILFHHEGGVDVGDVDSKVSSSLIPQSPSFTTALLSMLSSAERLIMLVIFGLSQHHLLVL